MRKQFLVLLCVLLLLGLSPVFGQTNQMVDQILSQQQFQIGHAAYILLVTQEIIDETATPAQALQALNQLPVGSRFASWNPQDTLTLGQYAYLTQGVLNIPKGLFSSIFAGPRYAVRDLRFLGIIQGRSYPGMDVSGERGLRILNRALSERERRL